MSELRPGLTDDRLSTVSVKTPFYKSIINLPSFQCVEENDFNYDPYDLFTLKTKITIPINKIMKKPVFIGFESILSGDRMVITITAYNGSKFLPFNKDQSRKISTLVDRAVIQNPRHCALYYNESVPTSKDGNSIPVEFVRNIITSFDIPEEYEPIIEDDYLLVNLYDPEDREYIKRYNTLSAKLNKYISDNYQLGEFKCSSTFAKDWFLNPVESDTITIENLYTPSWSDNRITRGDMFNFLRGRSQENQTLRFDFPGGTTNVQIYQLALELINSNLRFCIFNKQNPFVLIEAYNIGECSLAASLFESSMIIKQALNVAEFPIATPEVVRIKINEGNPNRILRLGFQITTAAGQIAVVYPTGDKQRPFTFATTIDYETDPLTLRLESFLNPEFKDKF